VANTSHVKQKLLLVSLIFLQLLVMPEKQSFGDRLFGLREKNKMSQQAVGDLISVSRSAVNGYEKGKSYPVADKLLKLAQYFKVSVDYLLTGEMLKSEPKAAAPQENLSYNPAASAGQVGVDAGLARKNKPNGGIPDFVVSSAGADKSARPRPLPGLDLLEAVATQGEQLAKVTAEVAELREAVAQLQQQPK
jgi:transcriptional regulator with XRE-family HTH domain